ncbi:MAG: fructose-bisphosphate aldolase class I [Gammaproteobacteria bacterium]|nr:fructose-bisphosphate aldolase class I [Gammaproteobacteria bacterium]
MNNQIKDLETTINHLAKKGKGILAADESIGTITKRFEALGIPSTEDTRRAYREMLMTTPHLSDYVGGVILFEETLNQTTSTGQKFADLLKSNNILAGIKVDKGLIPLLNTKDEQSTQGLDGLDERLKEYKAKGASFAKWRAVYSITENTPSTFAIKMNASGLAQYAAICQANGIVPIVEPEILIDSDHTIERCAEVTEQVLHAVFHALYKHKVKLEYIILKPSMVINGKKCSAKATAEQVGKETVKILRRTVPAAVPTINFLSGGQSCEEATANLNAMNLLPGNPWNLSFSYARALQDYSMKTWKGDSKNVAAAQKIFLQRAHLNSLASTGKYTPALEKETSPA